MRPANPFAAFLHLARFYGEGGVTVDDRPYFRTLLQPDGDVVIRVAARYYALERREREVRLRRHLARIRRVEASASTLRGAVGIFREYAWVPPAVTFVAGGTVLSWEWLGIALVVSGAMGLGLRFARTVSIRVALYYVQRTLGRTVRGSYAEPVVAARSAPNGDVR